MAESAKTAENWSAKVHCGLDDDKLMLRRLSGTEELSRPFHFHLDFISEDGAIDFSEVVGKPMSVEVTLAGGKSRWFSGIVARFTQGEVDEGFAVYHADLVPVIWTLSRSSHCRTWPETPTHDIVKEVLSLAPQASLDINSKMWTRLYTVQYRESDLDFASRLLEEEGFHYLFEHGDNEHKLLTRPPEAASGSPVVTFDVSRETVEAGLEEFRFSREQEFAPGFFEAAEFDWKDPNEPFSAKADTRLKAGFESGLGHTEHPVEFVKTLGGSSGSAEKLAKLRAMETDAAAVVFRGDSGSALISAGVLIEVSNRGENFDGSYYVTSVTHTLEIGTAPASGRGGETKYTNSFTCIPDSVAYAPPRRTPKPVVRGSHTAVVVSNEDPDGHARVQVRFPWAPEVSFWARVVQGWAGSGWGVQFHPRVGHEVVVEFLEGDPDQPIVTGRVYNGANPGPYSDNMKHGGIKTRSYDGGAEEYNELRFDDTPDAEEILLHAEKNWTIEVENDEGKSIGANRSESVAENVTIDIGGDRNEKVAGSRSCGVEGSKAETVGGSKSVSVDGELTETISKKMSVDVGDDRKLTVGGKLTDTVSKDATQSVGGALSQSIGKGANVDVADDLTTKVGKNAKTQVEKAYGLEAKEIAVKAKDSISFECGKAKLTLKKNGDVVLEGGKISIKGSKDVVVKGSKIGEN